MPWPGAWGLNAEAFTSRFVVTSASHLRPAVPERQSSGRLVAVCCPPDATLPDWRSTFSGSERQPDCWWLAPSCPSPGLPEAIGVKHSFCSACSKRHRHLCALLLHWSRGNQTGQIPRSAA